MEPRELTASVIIRAYNAEATLARAIESALAQDFSHDEYEIIIVDNGSTDGTPDVIQKYASDSRVRVIRQANSGAIAAGNAGFNAARGQYLALLDSDDMWETTFLSTLSKHFDSDPELDFVYADYVEECDGRRQTVQVSDVFQTIVDNAMYRTRSLLDAGGWTEGVLFAEYDLLLRTYDKWKRLHVAEPLSTYYRRRESLTGQAENVTKAIAQLAGRHPDKLPLIKTIRSYEW